MKKVTIIEVYLPERMRFIPFMLGIWDYSNRHTDWIVRRAPPAADILKHSTYANGVICGGGELTARQFAKLNTPFVTYGPCRHSFPNVRFDETVVGRSVADHFTDRGFPNFAFIEQSWPHSALRQKGFVTRLREQGFKVHIMPVSPDTEAHYRERIAEIADWLHPLPKPLAVMAPDDNTARQVIHACELIGVTVPEEVSVVGVDNDPMVCDVCTPTLSSAEPNMHMFGRECARLLHEQMQGKTAESVVLKNCTVHERASSDTLAAHDAVVAGTMAFIREHCVDKLNVGQVVRHSGLSRRMLEYRFRKELGKSPRELILDRQLRHVCELLSSTNYTLETIATKTGFLDATALCRIFKKKLRTTPISYRRKHYKR